MKISFVSSLALTVLLLAGCGDRSPAPEAPDAPAAESESNREPAPAAAPKAKEPKPTPAGEAKKEPSPAKEAERSDLQARLEKMYPMPEYQPLEVLVNDWKDVPDKVIEAVQVVTVRVPAEYKLHAGDREIGSSKAQPGHLAKPLDYRPGELLVTNSRDGKARAVVKLEDTDFKERVRQLYEEQVGKGRERVLAARKAAGDALAAQTGAREGEGAGAGAGGAAPSSTGFGGPQSDPRFKPAVDYLASGQMITRTLEEAKQWMWLGPEKHEGKTYDAILVNFEVETIFGVFPHSMKCLLQNGKVVDWVMVGYDA